MGGIFDLGRDRFGTVRPKRVKNFVDRLTHFSIVKFHREKPYFLCKKLQKMGFFCGFLAKTLAENFP
jgi:hypothetical protein